MGKKTKPEKKYKFKPEERGRVKLLIDQLNIINIKRSMIGQMLQDELAVIRKDNKLSNNYVLIDEGVTEYKVEDKK